MKISSLKAQANNPDRVSLFIDGEYKFSLGPGDILEEKLHVGLEIDEHRLDQLTELSRSGKVYDRLLRYALLRPHSRREMMVYARRKNLDLHAADTSITRLEKRGLVDDAKFAQTWLDNRRRHKFSSHRKIRIELRQKGIDESVISEVLRGDELSNEEILRQLIAKKMRNSRFKDETHLIKYLISQGFGLPDIKKALANDGENGAS